MKSVDLVIIGGGSAGMAAAIQAKKEGINDIIILEKDSYMGGVLDQCIHNGFGLTEFKEELAGPEYAQRFLDQVIELGITYKTSSKAIDLTKDRKVTYSNKDEGHVTVQAKAVIIATGCYERSGAMINLAGDRPSGIITAGLAQRYLNIHGYLCGKRIVILGSGDIGLIMARRMTLEGAKVISVNEINPYCAGLNRNVQQCLIDFNIPLNLSTTVKEVKGKKRLEKVILAKVDDHFNFIPGTEQEIECDTLLLSIGLTPYLSLLKNIECPLSLSSKGPIVNEYFETCYEGIFACGNGLHIHDVVDFVSDEGRSAGHFAKEYISNNLKHNETNNVVAGNNVLYVVPHLINKNTNVDVDIKFRVRKPVKASAIIIKSNDKIIKKLVKPALIPSEMNIIKLDNALLTNINNDIVVEVKEL